ncbi:MAG: tRNA (N(6)-L-threonylcarbamoyladenosine(37)-C(2))-methylthiotransferase MtaB [Planctomycetota bacterium]|nr:tRNA (N(6)-L-threonylcarbamoyladenosine(37)-C(2))-methylthiotransferase MtaB [Planctomycetota bacterium]MDA1211637.1 tRNA (N(6)-L-threonylcarbamoyladenosine(37)-C(2))-methylthiotransferase MtaB [Planctomycetota bacterium]
MNHQTPDIDTLVTLDNPRALMPSADDRSAYALKTCRLVTLGCKVNQYETQLVKEALLRSGYREANDDEAAELCVVNTCTVTGEGDAKGRQLIRQLARNNPGTKTLVMGCYATRDPQTIGDLPGVYEVVTDKRELPDVLARVGVAEMPDGIDRFDGHHRAFVKIQDGCILKCTYCIIPHVRPGLHSRPADQIEGEVRRLIDNGYQEIVLTGIHAGHYGVENTRGKSGLPPFRLSHLFQRLDRIPGNWRMRLSSIESAEMNDDFIAAAADCEHLCPQFHPSLQCGSDRVLRRMRRRYSVSRFLERLDHIRQRIADPAFSTDVIVGFPGETDDDFAQTLSTCREAGFMKIHIFPFSARQGTPAAEFDGQIPPPIIKKRCRELMELERNLAFQYYREYEGETIEVLVERRHEDRAGWLRGTDRRYLPIELPGELDDIGRFVRARGLKASKTSLTATR